ncbi:hypothetical protein HDV00_009515 [Rhizophlyctis rosea]|nr:hypothetical protein HDV00_009515 [Rhizophlyctis rosea]
MVCLTQVKTSNAQIRTHLPSSLVAVFVGGTSGVGEYTLKKFVQYAVRPCVYNIGRSQEAADRIIAECKELNPEAEVVFLKADVSLIKNVDVVCEEIKKREKWINFLVLSTGTFAFQEKTLENLRLFIALAHYTRARFIHNLLPLLTNAASIRRVLTIACAGFEFTPLTTTDMEAWSRPPSQLRAHGSTIITLTLIHFAQSAPSVSFIHCVPGLVNTNISRDAKGFGWSVYRVLLGLLSPFVCVPREECGERHVYLLTSGRFGDFEAFGRGVPVGEGLEGCVGVDGVVGSGVYSVNAVSDESSGPNALEAIKTLKEDQMDEYVWKDITDVFQWALECA